jgi:Fe-S-cluster-containing hydrogenase component 2
LKRIIVDAAECAGCRICELACSYHHEGRFSPRLSRVDVVKEDKYGLDYPVYCRQCDDCPPSDACPTGALNRDEYGATILDVEACINCGICANVCTYNAVKLDEASKPLICDLCGGDPVCVKKCPTNALTYEESGQVTDIPEGVFMALRERWGINT